MISEERETSSQKQKQFWNSQYSKGYIYGTYPSEAAVKTASFILSGGKPNQKMKLLELGGGYGRNSIYFASQLGLDAIVADFSDRVLALGRKLAAKYGVAVNFVEADVLKGSVAILHESFYIVFHNFFIHLLDEEQRAEVYRRAANLLAPDGFIVGAYLSTSDPECPKKNRDKGEGITTMLRGKRQHFFTKKEVIKELSPHFEILLFQEGCDPEKTVDSVRNTHYYFVVARKA